ncbi:SOS response-associated peptidase [Methylococcus sp. EFPC2]|uniref:SOS response-associated peptidase n=1 Tax=Methylococcus sp. EFPC2 TaxID=2812648 RepID=UPI0019688C6A|nr:SOS response-associated peptidase [Methylococcus sp. EFPC2]QSA97489.1 SOS response-associated peptidase [Methylococcus sp. EFPC2]
MCSNYIPAPRSIFLTAFRWEEPTFDYPQESYVSYRAPIRVIAPDSQAAELREAMFGLVPFWSKDTKIARHTYNARSETVAVKPSYRDPWKSRRYALVPMAGFYEPDYATGKPIRWRIERQDQEVFTVAAIWDYWRQPDGTGLTSFSMLTINADRHPVMGRFHAPGDEKRSLVIVPPEHRECWLNATTKEAGEFLRAMPADEFTARPDPRPPRS